MMALTGLSKDGKGGGEKGEGNFFEDWQTGEWTDYSNDSWQIRLQAFFEANWTWHIGSRQIGLRQIGPWQTWPLKFFFREFGPENHFGGKLGPENFVQQKYNNCGGSNLAYFLWVGYIQNGSPKTLFLQLRGFCISVFIFATFSSMRLYWALKALNSQFHLNIWTHLEHFMIRLFFFSLYFWI